MKIFEKKVFVIFLAISFLMVTFIVGIKIGIEFAGDTINPDYKQNMYTRLISTSLALEHIDNGDIATAHRILNEDANSLIVGLNELISDTEKDYLEENLPYILRRISKHRKKNMNRYIEYSGPNKEVNQVVLAILKKYEN